jgi:hypothetical protein
MRRLLAVGTLALTLTILTPPTSGQAAPSRDQVTGTATAVEEVGSPRMHVTAIQTRNGVRGRFLIHYPDGTTVAGRATCLVVSGNIGFVIGVITRASAPGPVPHNWAPGKYLAIGVKDSGEPGTGDLVNFSPGFDRNLQCVPRDADPIVPVVEGDYRVIDAP